MVVWAPRVGTEGGLGRFDQVRKKCAEPEMVCMVVSRFLKFPIQIEFIGKRLGGSSGLSRVLTPSGVGGYMRKRELRKHSAHSGDLPVPISRESKSQRVSRLTAAAV
jgi:hypothetical protein